MGWRFRKIWRLGPLRWSLSKRGIGWSIGLPGLRYGISPTGQRYVSIGLAGTGFYWIKYFGRAPRQVGTLPPPPTSPAQLPPPGQPTSPGQPVAGSQSRSRWWQQKGFPP